MKYLNSFIPKNLLIITGIISISFLQNFTMLAMESNTTTQTGTKKQHAPETPEITKENAWDLISNAIIAQDTNMIKHVLKFYKKNDIDINKPIHNNDDGQFLDDNHLLALAIFNDKVESARFLLKNGAKIQDKLIILEVQKPLSSIIRSKSMSELLVPLGAELPQNMNTPIRSIISSLEMDWLDTNRDSGINFIKYLYENGVPFSPQNIYDLKNALNRAQDAIPKTSLSSKKISHLKEAIDYLESKIPQRQN